MGRTVPSIATAVRRSQAWLSGSRPKCGSFIPPPGSVTQTFVSGVIALCFLLAATYFSPFDDDRVDVLNFVSQVLPY